MANAKISNAAVFVPPSPPIDPATVFAAELSGANSGPTMAGIKTTVLSGTYHDVTSSRALDVTYTNTQPVPMFLSRRSPRHRVRPICLSGAFSSAVLPTDQHPTFNGRFTGLLTLEKPTN